ncbi:MAG: outer membrane beta-barrel protein [Candidatus Zixiibacteriota bacterium]
MKKALFTLVVLTLTTSVSVAQTPKPFDLYAGGGITFGSSPDIFKTQHKEGYHLFGGIGFHMIPLIQFVGKIEYQSFAKDFDEFRTEITDLSGGTRRILMFGVDARLGTNVPTAPIRPFIFAGLGLARQSESDLETAFEIAIQDYDSQTDLYLNIGGGIEFKMLKIFNVFVQARYLNIKQDGGDLSLVPVSLGLKI